MTGLRSVLEHPQRAISTCVLLFLCSILAACGGAAADDYPGSGGATNATLLEIQTRSLPNGKAGVGYGPLPLVVVGASGPVYWDVISGDLPPGMAMTSDGAVAGAPEEAGFYPFTVAATDGLAEDTQSLAISVDTFGAFISSGLEHGDAWSGVPVRIETAGSAGEVTFEIVQNGSGGFFQNTNATTALYVPGAVRSSGVVDRVRVTDTTSGTVRELTLRVAPDPLVEHDAEFGMSDVWHVNFDYKRGDHPYATDWHNALVRLGLRDPASTDPLGTVADQLADMCCRVAVLRELNVMFGRDASGDIGDGLAISFPYDEPMGPFVKPGAGRLMSGRSNGYSVMTLSDGAAFGRVGMAMLDIGNNNHENNTPESGELGVFVNRITDRVISSYDRFGNVLAQNPVGATDVDALKAILYRESTSAGRYGVMDYTIDGLARSVAAVCAHEIGHSLGLEHTNPTTPGSIMNYASSVHETAEYYFLPDAMQTLQLVLPGAGRSSSGTQALKPAIQIPEGGVCVCAGH